MNNIRTRHIIRVSFSHAEEKKRVEKLAQNEGLSTSNFIRKQLNFEPLKWGGAQLEKLTQRKLKLKKDSRKHLRGLQTIIEKLTQPELGVLQDYFSNKFVSLRDINIAYLDNSVRKYSLEEFDSESLIDKLKKLDKVSKQALEFAINEYPNDNFQYQDLHGCVNQLIEKSKE